MSGSINDFMDKDQREKSDFVLEENKDEILKYLAEKGVAYPTEMSRSLNISIEGINKLIMHFARLGFVKHIIPNPTEPQEEFRGRMKEMWISGMSTYNSFNQRSWWTITAAGIEFLKAKYKGQDLQIKASLVKRERYEVKDEATKTV